MNAKKFSDAMSELDCKYIDEALNYKKKAKKPRWIKWGSYCGLFVLDSTINRILLLIQFNIMRLLIILLLSVFLLKI